MAITTPDAIPGEVIEAAWGDAVRVDLTNHDTRINQQVPRTGNVTVTGPLFIGGSAPNPGTALYTDGHTTSVCNTDGIANLTLNRRTTPANSNTQPLQVFQRVDIVVGSITISGSTGVVYNTTSDKRLKTLTRPVDPDEAVAKLAAIEPVNFTWTSDPAAGERIGFFAQDLAAIAPEVVTPGTGDPGDPDFIPWMVDHATLVPTLVAAIQALTARITALEEATP